MTQTVRRHDRTLLGKAQRTPQGGVRLPARPTRVGVLEYLRDDGSVQREYRPPDEVFADASLQSLADATVTDLHSGTVNPATYRELTRGHVSGMPRQDGEFVAADLVIQDADEIALIDSGERSELSCGYDCVLDMTPGVSPEGKEYDAIQRVITYNHVAVGPSDWGRAGPDVKLRLDSNSGLPVLRLDAAGHQLAEAPMPAPVKKKDEGETAPASDETKKTDGTCATCGAPTGEDGKYVAPKADTDTVEAEKDAVQAKLDAANAKIKKLESGRTDAGDRGARDHLVATATKAGIPISRKDGDKTVALDDDAIRRAVIAKAYPDRRLDGKSTAYLEVAFDDACDVLATQGLGEVHHVAKTDHADGTEGDLWSRFQLQNRADRASKGR